MTLMFEVILGTRNGTSSAERERKIICTKCVFARIIPIKYVFEASDARAFSFALLLRSVATIVAAANDCRLRTMLIEPLANSNTQSINHFSFSQPISDMSAFSSSSPLRRRWIFPLAFFLCCRKQNELLKWRLMISEEGHWNIRFTRMNTYQNIRRTIKCRLHWLNLMVGIIDVSRPSSSSPLICTALDYTKSISPKSKTKSKSKRILLVRSSQLGFIIFYDDKSARNTTLNH